MSEKLLPARESNSAVASSIIDNTMLVQIELLAWLFLGERLSSRGVAGLILAMVGALMVQMAAAQTPDQQAG